MANKKEALKDYLLDNNVEYNKSNGFYEINGEPEVEDKLKEYVKENGYGILASVISELIDEDDYVDTDINYDDEYCDDDDTDWDEYYEEEEYTSPYKEDDYEEYCDEPIIDATIIDASKIDASKYDDVTISEASIDRLYNKWNDKDNDDKEDEKFKRQSLESLKEERFNPYNWTAEEDSLPFGSVSFDDYWAEKIHQGRKSVYPFTNNVESSEVDDKGYITDKWTTEDDEEIKKYTNDDKGQWVDKESSDGLVSGEFVSNKQMTDDYYGKIDQNEFSSYNNIIDNREDLEELRKELEANREEFDNVQHPKHYNMFSQEVIDTIGEWIEPLGDSVLGYYVGTSLKYIPRSTYKNESPLEDLEKSLFYLTRAVERAKELYGEQS